MWARLRACVFARARARVFVFSVLVKLSIKISEVCNTCDKSGSRNIKKKGEKNKLYELSKSAALPSDKRQSLQGALPRAARACKIPLQRRVSRPFLLLLKTSSLRRGDLNGCMRMFSEHVRVQR